MRLRFELEILRDVWAMTWPTITYSVLESLVLLTDVYMVGRLGTAVAKDAVSAVGISSQIMMLVMVSAFAVTVGTATLVAQFIGAGKRVEAGETARQALLAIFAVSWLLAVPMVVLSAPILRAMGADAGVLRFGVPYMQISFAGVVMVSLNFATSAIFRGSGDMITPLKIAAVINVLNLGLNYALIFGCGPFPALGVSGAALGTVISRGIGGVVAVYLLSRPGGRIQVRWANGLRPNWDVLRRMLRIGLPAAGTGLLRNGARTLFLRVLTATAASSSAAVSAYVVASRLSMTVILPALAFQAAATTLVGQAIGRGDRDQAERLAWEAIKLCALVMLVVSAALFFAAWPLTRFFHSDHAVYGASVQVIRFVAVGQVFASIAIVTSGALAGAGDTRPAFAYTAITDWGLTLPVAWALAIGLGLGASGAWWPLAIAPGVQAVLLVGRFARGAWRHITV